VLVFTDPVPTLSLIYIPLVLSCTMLS